jgi:hypothetical protein
VRPAWLHSSGPVTVRGSRRSPVPDCRSSAWCPRPLWDPCLPAVPLALFWVERFRALCPSSCRARRSTLFRPSTCIRRTLRVRATRPVVWARVPGPPAASMRRHEPLRAEPSNIKPARTAPRRACAIIASAWSAVSSPSSCNLWRRSLARSPVVAVASSESHVPGLLMEPPQPPFSLPRSAAPWRGPRLR